MRCEPSFSLWHRRASRYWYHWSPHSIALFFSLSSVYFSCSLRVRAFFRSDQLAQETEKITAHARALRLQAVKSSCSRESAHFVLGRASNGALIYAKDRRARKLLIACGRHFDAMRRRRSESGRRGGRVQATELLPIAIAATASKRASKRAFFFFPSPCLSARNTHIHAEEWARKEHRDGLHGWP